jgi:hypothetical protein
LLGPFQPLLQLLQVLVVAATLFIFILSFSVSYIFNITFSYIHPSPFAEASLNYCSKMKCSTIFAGKDAENTWLENFKGMHPVYE